MQKEEEVECALNRWIYWCEFYLRDGRPPFAIWPLYVQQDQHVVQPIYFIGFLFILSTIHW